MYDPRGTKNMVFSRYFIMTCSDKKKQGKQKTFTEIKAL